MWKEDKELLELLNFTKQNIDPPKLEIMLNNLVKGSIYNYYFKKYGNFYGDYEVDNIILTNNIISVNTKFIYTNKDVRTLLITLICKFPASVIGKSGSGIKALEEKLLEDMRVVFNFLYSDSDSELKLEMKLEEQNTWNDKFSYGNIINRIKEGGYYKTV